MRTPHESGQRVAPQRLPAILVFAAVDPSAGAGLAADVMTIAALGCHPLPVATALTVQDTAGVRAISAVDGACVREQARALLEDIPVAAFKVGVLGSAGNVAVVADIVAEFPQVPLVVDPVLASGRGERLADAQVVNSLRARLLPRATMVTPNTLEAQELARPDQRTSAPAPASDDECVRSVLRCGCEYLLLTGTHAPTAEVVNRLYRRPGVLVRSDAWQRLPGSYHGSGCTLASAIAAWLGRGLAVDDAVRAAQDYTWRSLAAAFRPGRGQDIPDRFWQWRCGSANTDG